MRKKTLKKNRIKKIVKTKEFWTGVVMVVTSMAFGTSYIMHSHIIKPSFTQKQSRIASPILESKVTKSVTPITPTPTDTEVEVTVKENDSFWEISKRACKTGKYFLVVQDLNTADPYFDGLHVGDKVKVKCSFD